MRRNLGFLAALVVAAMMPSGESAWATGFPAVAFGQQLLGATQTTAPTNWGGLPPVGTEPQEIMIRLKSDSTTASSFAAANITFHLPGFLGADQTWAFTSTTVKMYARSWDGKITALDKLAAAGNVAQWTTSTQMLLLRMGAVTSAEASGAELLVSLEAASFALGGGPIPPVCSARDVSAYVAAFASPVAATALLTSVSKMSPVGCFSQAAQLLGVQAHYWAVKKIGQEATTNAPGADMTFTVTLAPSMDLASSTGTVSTITISGLTGTETSDSSTLPITLKSGAHMSSTGMFSQTVSSTSNVANTAEWKQTLGTLILTVASGRQMAAFTPVTFSFALKLPNAAAAAPTTISASASFGTSVLVDKAVMDRGSDSSAPMLVVAAVFTTAHIGHKVTGPGQQNTITATIVSNTLHQTTSSSTSSITIAGLVGSTTSDSSTQNPIAVTQLAGPSTLSGLFTEGGVADRAKWTKETGKLVLTVTSGRSMVAGEEYVFSFNLINSGTPAASPSVSIQSTACPVAAMRSAPGDAAPLLVKTASFTVKKVGQSSPYISASNQLRVTLMTNVGIQAVGSDLTAGVTLTGLSGFTNADGDLTIDNRGYNSVGDIFSKATWNKAEARLVLSIAAGKQLQASTLYVLGVTLTNPATGQASPAISISQTGSTAATIAAVAVDPGSGDKAPLYVKAPGFETGRVGQSSSSPAGVNTITVTLQSNLAITASAQVTIEGLVNTRTDDSLAMSVSGCAGIFKSPAGVANQGKWDRAAGRLVVVATSTIAAGTTVSCSFAISNPSGIQAASKVNVVVNSVSTGQISNMIPAFTLRNAPGSHGPLLIQAGAFLTANIGQSSPFPSVTSNVITITINSNVAMSSVGSASATLTITGLLNSETTDTSSLAISGSPFATAVGGKAAWVKATGTLTLTVVSGQSLSGNTDYIFSFSLQSPAASQPAPEVTISAAGGSSIAATVLTQAADGCVFSVGDTAAFFIHPASFLSKTVIFSRTTPGSSTSVGFVLRSAVQLDASASFSSLIVITFPLYFSTAASSTLAITSSNPSIFGSSAEWVPSTGTLTIKVQSGQTLLANTEYRVNVVFNTHNNFLSPLPPTIEVQGSARSIASEAMDVSSAGISEATFTGTTPNTATGITLTLQLEQAFEKGDSLIVRLPGFGGSSTSSSDQIWGVSSAPSIFSTEASSELYGDAIAAGHAVAIATFRAGAHGRTPSEASLKNGLLGGTFPLTSSDTDVFGAHNVYAERTLKIGGTADEYNVYRSDAASAAIPGVLHFFPPYKQRSGVAAVPKGTFYELVPELELVAKKGTCAGTRITITIPSSSGILLPAVDAAQASVTVSHVRGGAMPTAVVGPGPADVDNLVDNNVRASAGASNLTLTLASSADPSGLMLYPSRLPPLSSINIDGYRPIADFDAENKVATLLAGFGALKKTTIMSTEATAKLTGAALSHTKNIANSAVSMWLGLADKSVITPTLESGHLLQVGEEMFKYTGSSAKTIASLSDPGTLGDTCALSGTACAGTSCATITFAGCSDNPTATLTFTAGDTSAGSITLTHAGGCLAVEEASLVGTITLASGVACTTAPACGAGCAPTFAAAANVVHVERQLLGTSAFTKSCSVASKCTDTVNPALVYLTEGTLASLLYTSSSAELDYLAAQSLRIATTTTVSTLAAGDHVTAVSLPETIGSNCVINGANCSSSTTGCATLTMAGCAVAPSVTAVFTSGVVTAFTLAGVNGHGGSVCQLGATVTGTLALSAGVTCDTVPSCGTGCQITRDTAKDVVVVKYASSQAAVAFPQSSTVARMHTAHADTKFRITLVPSSPLKIGSSLDIETVAPGTIISNPVVGRAYIFTDPATGLTLMTLVALGPVTSFSADWKKNADGTAIVYPAEGATALVKSGENIIAGRAVDLVLVLPTGATYGVNMTMPISFNNQGVLPTARRASAPTGYEYRINALCTCAASADATSASCSANASGTQQVLLMATTLCTPATPEPQSNALAWGLGLGLGLGIPLVGLCLFLACRAAKPAPPPRPQYKEEAESQYSLEPPQPYQQGFYAPTYSPRQEMMVPMPMQQSPTLYSTTVPTGSPTLAPMNMPSLYASAPGHHSPSVPVYINLSPDHSPPPPAMSSVVYSGSRSPAAATLQPAGYTAEGHRLYVDLSVSPPHQVQQFSAPLVEHVSSRAPSSPPAYYPAAPQPPIARPIVQVSPTGDGGNRLPYGV